LVYLDALLPGAVTCADITPEIKVIKKIKLVLTTGNIDAITTT